MSRRRLLNLLALSIGLSVLAVTIWRIGFDTVVGHLGAVGLGFLVLIASSIVSCLLDAWSLRVSLGGGVGIGRLLGIGLAGAAVNQFTPLGEGGEIVKGNMLLEHVPGHKAVSAVLAWNLAHRASKHVIIFLGPLLMLLVDFDRFGGWMLAGFVVAAIIASIPTALLFLLAGSRGAERIVRLLRHIPWVRQGVSDRLVQKARDTDGLLKEYTTTRRRDAWKMFAIQMAGKLVGIADYWLVQWMLGGQLNPIEAAFIVSGSQVVGIVLSILPVQIGIRDRKSVV